LLSFFYIPGHKNVIIMKEDWVKELDNQNKSGETTPTSPDLNLDSMAYIVYSSGTTGRPKGNISLYLFKFVPR